MRFYLHREDEDDYNSIHVCCTKEWLQKNNKSLENDFVDTSPGKLYDLKLTYTLLGQYFCSSSSIEAYDYLNVHLTTQWLYREYASMNILLRSTKEWQVIR
jgi:hypothetical protein